MNLLHLLSRLFRRKHRVPEGQRVISATPLGSSCYPADVYIYSPDGTTTFIGTFASAADLEAYLSAHAASTAQGGGE